MDTWEETPRRGADDHGTTGTSSRIHRARASPILCAVTDGRDARCALVKTFALIPLVASCYIPRMRHETQVNIRLPQPMVDLLRAIAVEDDRSLTATVRRIVKLHLDREQSDGEA